MEMAEVPSNWNDSDPLPESNSDAWKLLSKEKSQLVAGCTQIIWSSRPSSFVGSAFKFKFLVKLNQDAMPIWRYRHCRDVYHIVVRQVRDVALTVTWVTELHRNPTQFPDRKGCVSHTVTCRAPLLPPNGFLCPWFSEATMYF